MKKILIYIGILVVGLGLGYWMFGGSEGGVEQEEHEHSEAEAQMWTCSMHPQIMQPEPGDCPICGMDLIPAEAGADGLTADQFKMSENALALANIQTTLVGGDEASGTTLQLSGEIQVDEEANAVQVAYFAGRIEELHVAVTGEQVSRGEPLATLYSPELVAAQQELLTAARMKETQPGLYQAVKKKLRLWKLSEQQIDRIEASGEVRENFPVFATVSGTVTEKMVQEGDYVTQGQPLFEIADLNEVWAVFDVYENQVRNVREGQVISIRTNAYPEQEFDATISFIDPVLNSSRRTVRVRAELENPEDLLKPGMFVKGTLQSTEGATPQQSIVIPKSAVLWTGERSLVYIKPISTEPVFEMREVKLGSELGAHYVVLEGLETGEEIVVNGTFTVDAAAQLQGKKSMMNSSEGMPADPNQMKMNLPETFQKDFTTILSSYFGLKDALVDSDVEAAGSKAREMLQGLGSLRTENLGAMEVSHLDEMVQMLEAISENEILENQREHFVLLSQNMIAFASNLDELENPVFVQHCPMANRDKGADWLSLSEEIRNPYYGEAMLTCGEVVRKIN